MNSMLHIGNDTINNKDSVIDAATAIEMVFTSARENTMDQDTVVSALEALAKVAEIKNITITNSVFKNVSGPEADDSADSTPDDSAESTSKNYTEDLSKEV